ncbi:DHA2 family efflux MFS transporter permease subunit [Alkanindiges sp. WGS2144]|uniref:DHA2 family efflux MFS transporter permease subunit n=1 Tax=Alkanindiges sp. WGS2144 TaxID=3366808 RepID=UPI0037533A19
MMKISPAAAWAMFGAMVFGNFMAILDIQIVASSINEIQAGLGASQSEVAWVQTIYLIAEVIAIPLSALLSNLFSTRIYFTISALGFSIASLLCGLAWNLESMLVFRAIQGFLGGGMIPTTMAALFVLFPKSKQALPLVAIGMVSTLGPAIGPTLGGWLTTHLSWHWMFFINILPGLLIAAFVFAAQDLDKPDFSLFSKIDWLGLGSMALFLGCLEYVLDEGPRNDWFSDHSILYAFICCVTAALIFFYRCFTSRHPIVDLSVFGNRNFALSSMMTFVLGIALYGMVYIVPVFLGQVRGMNSSQIGHIMLVMGVTMFLFAPIAGSVMSRFDPRKVIFIGLGVAALGVAMNANLTIQSDFDEFFWPQILRGIGMMMGLIVMSQLAMSTLSLDKIKGASGVYNLTRNIGGAIGLAIINTLIDQQRAVHISSLESQLTPDRIEVTSYLSQTAEKYRAVFGDQADQYALSLLYKQMQQQALTLAFNDILIMLAVLMFAAGLLVVFVKKTKPAMTDNMPVH